MEVIELSYPHQLKEEECEPIAMALGYFDGVHLGHQKVINAAIEEAKANNIKSGVMTFHPHPSVVLGRKQQTVEYITPIKQKQKVIEQLGVDYFYLICFNQSFAGLTPQEFVDEYLIGLNVRHVVGGFDYTYGRMGKGTMETLPFHSRGEFTYTIVDKLEQNGEKISSTKIRDMILNGEVEQLPQFLGRDYQLEGKVVGGDQRGRTIGFPTANIDLLDRYLIPANGVYAVEMYVNGKWHEGVCNIGYKPTFKEEIPLKPTIEVHLFDFNKMIYSEIVKVKWKKRLRSERKFDSVDELIKQINLDKNEAIRFFSTC